MGRIRKKKKQTGDEHPVDNKDNFTARQDSGSTSRTAKGRTHLVLLIILLILVAVLAAAIISHTVYYRNHWYNNTTINGLDVSKMRLSEAEDLLVAQYDDYSLTITGREDGSLTIDGSDIDYTMAVNSDYESLYESQHDGFVLFPGASDYSLTFDVSYNTETLQAILTDSELIAGSETYPILAPKNAKVKFSEEKKCYEMIDERPGNTLDYDAFLSAVNTALTDSQTELDLTDETAFADIYEAPKITSEDEELNDKLTACNEAAVRYIVWNMEDGTKEKITPTEISSWITYKNGKVKYDFDAVADWVEEFCLKYKTVGSNRKITAHNGKTVTVKGGDYGWQLNYDETLSQAKKALKKQIDNEAIEDYLDDPSTENKKAITIKKEVNYLNTAYQMNGEKKEYDWDPDNYIEVSTAAQKVYVIRNGKVKFSCRCITGKPEEGRKTPKGTYFIKEHKEECVLTGEDYSTPVTNWVRITWTGTGFHTASWQPWYRWTKDLYKTNGSHGCINLEESDAKKIYEMSNYREAVFIY